MASTMSQRIIPHLSQMHLKGSLRKIEGKDVAKADKKVGFSSLEIVEFLVEIGDNPS